MRFLEDGRIELDNNRAQRIIKQFVIGRRNWLFANTPKGARASAAIYSIIETARGNAHQAARMTQEPGNWANSWLELEYLQVGNRWPGGGWGICRGTMPGFYMCRIAFKLLVQGIASPIGMGYRLGTAECRSPRRTDPHPGRGSRHTMDYLIGISANWKGSKGPSDKVRQVFKQVSKLPRRQQEKVVEFVEAFVQHKAAAG